MSIVPNSFQVPNAYIDQAMEYLTEGEFRVLMFATRHIMGWQDKIARRKGAISLTMFENGFTTQAGKRYAGCGLSKKSIITALEGLIKYGFLTKCGKATEDGQEWELHDDGIQWGALIERYNSKSTARQQQTQKARIASQSKQGGVSNTPLSSSGVEHTSTGVVEHTSTGVVEHTESKLSKAISKPTPRKSAKSSVVTYPKGYDYRRWTDNHLSHYFETHCEDMKLLINAWGDFYEALVEMPKKLALAYIETLDELTRLGLVTTQYQSLATFTHAKITWKDNVTPLDMLNMFNNWRKAQEGKLSKPILTADEQRRYNAVIAGIRPRSNGGEQS